MRKPAKTSATRPETGDTVWTCEVKATTAMTVGDRFGVVCQGPEVKSLNAAGLALELPKADRFRLKILENKSTSVSSVDFVVTSYVPGDTKLADVVLTDGVSRIRLSGIEFTVGSVIKEGEKPEAFPLYPAMNISWPMSVLVTIAAFFVSLILLIGLFFRSRAKKRKFKAWMESARTPLSPRDQLSRDMRWAVKEREALKQIELLETAVRRFLSFELQEPLMTASAKSVLKSVLRKKPRDKKRLTPLTIRLFGEFRRVTESLSSSQLSNLEALNVTLPQVHELTREFAEIFVASGSVKARKP